MWVSQSENIFPHVHIGDEANGQRAWAGAIEIYPNNSPLDMLAALFSIDEQFILIILLYRHPGHVGEYINELLEALTLLPLNQYKFYIVGDVNFDQRLSENPLGNVMRTLQLCQLSSFSTHSSGGILDIILASNSAVMEFVPTYYSDHSILLLEL